MPVSARNTLAAMADLSTALLSQLVKGASSSIRSGLVASPFLFFFAGPSRTTDCPGSLRLRLQHTADALLEVTRSNSASTPSRITLA
ncbi:hypothetical protein H9Q73_011395 [Fusarium xylarioides]|nr:hypothetical protein H9Q73_011395 [Fusarium xylarioides]